MDRESKYKATKQIESLQKNPPRPTAGDYAKAREMAKKEKSRQQKAEQDVDNHISNEIKEMSKDVAEHFHTRCTITQKFHGFGEGKVRRLICAFCNEHCSEEWHHINDQWWGSEHKQFSGLPEQERERLCLSQKRM